MAEREVEDPVRKGSGLKGAGNEGAHTCVKGHITWASNAHSRHILR
jgi:hypothetical protein